MHYYVGKLESKKWTLLETVSQPLLLNANSTTLLNKDYCCSAEIVMCAFVTKNGCLLPLSVYTVSLQPITHSSAHWSSWVQFTVLDYHLADAMGTRHLFLVLLLSLLLLHFTIFIYIDVTLYSTSSACVGVAKKDVEIVVFNFFFILIIITEHTIINKVHVTHKTAQYSWSDIVHFVACIITFTFIQTKMFKSYTLP